MRLLSDTPRIMLAAPKSGSGKTLLTCGLLEILRRRGLNRSRQNVTDWHDPHRFTAMCLAFPGETAAFRRQGVVEGLGGAGRTGGNCSL